MISLTTKVSDWIISLCSSGAIKTACDIQIDGKRGPGRNKMSWKTLTQRDCREWNLNEVDPCDKDVRGSSVISDMRASSHQPGASCSKHR